MCEAGHSLVTIRTETRNFRLNMPWKVTRLHVYRDHDSLKNPGRAGRLRRKIRPLEIALAASFEALDVRRRGSSLTLVY